MELAAYCLRGLEELLADEIRAIGLAVTLAEPGCVIFSCDDYATIPWVMDHIRIAEHIDLVCWRGRLEPTLEHIETLVESLSYEALFDPELSFAVRATRHGSHSFSSVDVMQRAARGLTRAMERDGHKIHANLKHPQQFFRAYLHDDFFCFGLSANGQRLSKRYHLSFEHEAPINRTLAAALLWESSFRHHGHLCDPMCGGGTLLIEAGLWRRRSRLALTDHRYDFFAHRYAAQATIVDKPAPDLGIPIKPIIGGERSARKVAGATQNLAHFGLFDSIKVHHGSARRLDYIAPREHPLVVTNPPYGIRVMRPREVDQLYLDFAQALATKEVQEIVGISTKKHAWLEAFERAGFCLSSLREVYYGDMPAFIMKHRL